METVRSVAVGRWSGRKGRKRPGEAPMPQGEVVSGDGGEGRRIEDECGGAAEGTGADERNDGSRLLGATGPQTTPGAGRGVLVQLSRELCPEARVQI